MNQNKFIFTIIVFLLIFDILNAKTSEADKTLEKLLPPSDWVSGWQWERKPMYFYPENLFEYIDGAADLYLAYGFNELVTITFSSKNELSLIIDVYDMGTPLNAFGIYSNYRSPEGNFQAMGTEAMVSDYNIRFYHDRYVVDLNASNSEQDLLDFMVQAANEISSRIDTPKEAPEILTLLPSEHLIDKTQKYISRGLLGQEFFPCGLEATYQLDSTYVKAFIVLCDSTKGAEKAFQAFSDYIGDEGEDFAQLKIDEQPAISGMLPYHQYALAAKIDQYIYGVVDLPDPATGTELMKALRSQILAVLSK